MFGCRFVEEQRARLLKVHLDGVHVFDFHVFDRVHGLETLAVPHQRERLRLRGVRTRPVRFGQFFDGSRLQFVSNSLKR